MQVVAPHSDSGHRQKVASALGCEGSPRLALGAILEQLHHSDAVQDSTAPRLTALYLTVFAVLKFCPLSGLSSWKGSRSLLNRGICRLLGGFPKGFAASRPKNRLQQKSVYKSGGIKTKPQKCPHHITIRHGTFLSVHWSASPSFLPDPVVHF